jgi:hypothetical protein
MSLEIGRVWVDVVQLHELELAMEGCAMTKTKDVV